MPTIEKEILFAEDEGVNYDTDPGVVDTDAQIVFSPDYKEGGTLYRRGIQHVVQDPLRVGVVGKRQPTISFQQELRGNSASLRRAANCSSMGRSMLLATALSASRLAANCFTSFWRRLFFSMAS